MAEFGRGAALGAIAVAFMCGPFMVGCSDGADFEFHAPLLEATGVKLVSDDHKKSENLPERASLIMPPSYDLPTPGQPAAAQVAEAKLPKDPEQAKKTAAQKKAADHEKYCKEGEWNGKGGIGEFDKATGKEQRCPTKWGEALNKTFTNTSSSQPAGSAPAGN
jgi:hypothetical protein